MKHETFIKQLLIYCNYVIFFFLSLGQVGRISSQNQEVNIYLHEIFMAISVCFWLWSVVKNHNVKSKITILFKADSVIRAMAFFLGALLISLVFQSGRYINDVNFIGLLYYLRLALYAGYFFVLKDIKKKYIIRGLVMFTTLTIISAVIQYFFYSNLRNLYYLGWDPHQYRVFGTFFDTTTMGIVLTILFYWIVGVITSKSQSKKIQYVALGIVFLLILLTYSRITYLSFIVGILYYAYSKRSTLIALIVVLFIMVVPFLPRPAGEGVKLERLFSIESRINDYGEGIELVKKNAILGVGYNRLMFFRQNKNGEYPSHSRASFSSTYMTILATSGAIGIITLLYLLVVVFYNVSLIGKVITIVVSVASVFDNVLLTNFILLLFLVTTTLYSKDP